MIEDALAYRHSLTKHSVYEDTSQLARIISSYNLESVIDLGCGVGLLAKNLQEFGVKVYQLDGSLAMLIIAKAEIIRDGKLVYGRIGTVPFPEKITSGVVLSFVLHHLKGIERKMCFSECHRVLKENGILFIFERIPRNKMVFLLFPIYWYLFYKHNHEWKEEMPAVSTLKMLDRELTVGGFKILQTIEVIEPRSKWFRRFFLPKTIVIAIKK